MGGGFYRLEAAQAFLETGGSRCPVTNQPIAKVKEVPSSLEDIHEDMSWVMLLECARDVDSDWESLCEVRCLVGGPKDLVPDL